MIREGFAFSIWLPVFDVTLIGPVIYLVYNKIKPSFALPHQYPHRLVQYPGTPGLRNYGLLFRLPLLRLSA